MLATMMHASVDSPLHHPTLELPSLFANLDPHNSSPTNANASPMFNPDLDDQRDDSSTDTELFEPLSSYIDPTSYNNDPQKRQRVI
jgi:hypothetical protein